MTKSSKQERDPIFIGAENALKRASRRARKIAFQTNTPLVIYENGMIIRHKVTQKELDSFE